MQMQMHEQAPSALAFDCEIADFAATLAALAHEHACAVREDEEMALRVAFDDTSVAGKLTY